MKKTILLLFIFLMVSCSEDKKPKPRGFLALNYSLPEYSEVKLNCPYTFERNELAAINPAQGTSPCWLNLDYSLLDGTIFITYQPVNNNIDSLLMDAQKLPLQHTVKADVIEGDVYVNEYNNTYGILYEVQGNAASQVQFYLTDSTNHFLTGSVYFNTVPNFDSIQPAASYLKQDMKHLMETLRWKQ